MLDWLVEWGVKKWVLGAVNKALDAYRVNVDRARAIVAVYAGKVKALPATAGTYTVVCVALQAGAADELVEIAPWQPFSVTVS